jgi:hypothetical protein
MKTSFYSNKIDKEGTFVSTEKINPTPNFQKKHIILPSIQMAMAWIQNFFAIMALCSNMSSHFAAIEMDKNHLLSQPAGQR